MNKLLAITLGVTLAGIGTAALAARNTSGVYSLPSGNPVSTRTTISASWANSTLGDISTALSGSLSRDGWGGMRAPLALTDGTVNAPGLSFVNESGSGLYRIGTNNVGMSVNQVKQQEWTTTGTVVNGTMGVLDAASGFSSGFKAPALAASYSLTLPTALPPATQFLTVSSAGAMASQAIGRPDLPAVGAQISGSSGAFTTTSSTPVDVTNLTVSITTTGRPVAVFLQSDGTTSSYVGKSDTTNNSLFVYILRDGSTISQLQYYVNGALLNVPAGIMHLDVPSAGAHTYKIQAATTGGATVRVGNQKLVAFEL